MVKYIKKVSRLVTLTYPWEECVWYIINNPEINTTSDYVALYKVSTHLLNEKEN